MAAAAGGRAGLSAGPGRPGPAGAPPGRCARSTWPPHRFVAAGAGDAAPLGAELAGQAQRLPGGQEAWLVVDGTALPGKRDRSVRFDPQYASALGNATSDVRRRCRRA
jgi:uncharacterized protein YfaP (DUF2135 family)